MKRAMIWAALVAMATTACTEDARPDPTQGSGGSSSTSTSEVSSSVSTGSGEEQARYTAGTRLRVRQLRGADGSLEQIGWHDSTTGQPCGFEVAEDGATRCLPTLRALVFDDVFADAACLSPAVFVAPSGADVDDEYASEQGTGRAFRFAPSDSQMYFGNPCQAGGTARLAETLEPSELVAATEEIAQ